MFTLLKGHFGPAVLCAAIAAACGPAHAQNHETEPKTKDAERGVVQLAPVVVEGTRVFGMPSSEITGGYTVQAATVGSRTSTLLRGIPQSVTVVTHARIVDQNLDTLDKMAQRTPGMRILTNDTGRSSVYARGYEYSEFNLNGLSAPMASINGTLPSLAAIDRVEIMRGPSGLLNSTSEMGGIVNLVLKRPTDRFQASATGRYGSYSQHYLAVDVAGPLTTSGRVGGRLVLADSHTDGFTDHADNTGRTLYGALDFELGSRTTGFLAFLGQDRDITVSNGLATNPDGSLLDVPRSTFFGAKWNSFESRSNDVIGELKHDFADNGQGRLAARYTDRQADCNYVFGAGALAADDSVRVAGLGCDVGETALSLDASYSQIFELFSNPGGFVVGADHKRFKTDAVRARYRSQDAVQLEDFPNLPYLDILANPGSRISSTNTVLEETGVYAKTTIRPWSPLAIVAGARLSRYSIEQTNKVSGKYEQQKKSSQFTPYAGLIFDVGQHYSLYASYSKVFNPQTAYDKNGDLVRPRTGEQYEIGTKASYLDGRFNARVTLFRLFDRHHAASVPQQNYSAPLDSRRVQGAEIEVNGSPMDGLQLIAGYTWLDMQVDPGDLNRGDPSAIYLLMPEDSFKLWAKYGFQSGSLRGLEFGGGVTTSSGFQSSQGIKADGHTVLDVMLGYRFNQQLSARLNVNNLLDETYYTRVGSKGTFNFFGAPRNVVASVRYQF